MTLLTTRESLPFAFVLLVATFARLPGLDGPLWYDEILLLVGSFRLPLAQLITSYPGATHHPLYAVLATLSSTAFGETPLALRLPALVFGVLAISSAMIFVRVLGTLSQALVVGALLALSQPAVWYAQNARGYTGLMFFITTGSLLFYLGWRGKKWAWPWYSLVVALGAYTHPFMVTVPVSHAVLLVADVVGGSRIRFHPAAGASRWAWIAIAAGGALTALLYAPAVPQLIAYYSSAGLGGDPTADPFSLLHAPIAALAARPLLALTAGAVGVLGVFGLVAYSRRDPLALAVLILPGILGALVALLALRGVAPQFFVCLLPVALILVVSCLWLVPVRPRSAVISCLFVGSLLTLAPVYRYPKQDFPGALAYVRQHAAQEASIAGFGMAGSAYVLYYAPELGCIYTQEEYDELLGRGDETWILMTFSHDARTRLGPIHEHLVRDFALVETFPGTVDDGELFVYYRSKEAAI